MSIDPDKKYRTRDGRPVRIYAMDGAMPHRIHGALWDEGFEGYLPCSWNINGKRGVSGCDLIEVTLADELRDQIPWEWLLPEIGWVAYSPYCRKWRGYTVEPRPNARIGDGLWSLPPYGGEVFNLDCVSMPPVATERWRETLIQRPEGR